MEPEDRPGLQALTGALGVLTSAGILIFALFPLALPILVLSGLLLVPLIPFAIVGGVLAGIALAIRAGVRRLRRPRPRAGGRRDERAAERTPARPRMSRPGSVIQ